MSSNEIDALIGRITSAGDFPGPTNGQEEEDPDEIIRRVQLAGQQMLAEQEEGGGFLGFLRDLQEGFRTIDPEATFTRLAQGAIEGRPVEAVKEEAGRQLGLASGLAETTVGSLAAAGQAVGSVVALLPGEDTRAMFNVSTNARSALTKFETRLEQQARALGTSDEVIMQSKMMGGFIGYTVPLSLSVKIVGRLGLGGAGFVRDAGVGAVMGGLFREGSIEERLKNAAKDAGLFGGLSLIAAGLALPIMALRLKRARFKADMAGEAANLERIRIGTSEEGAPRVILMEQDPVDGIFKILNEEQYIVQSSSAAKLLGFSADERALVQAIRQVSESKASFGIIQDFENAEALIPLFKETFPVLKFSIIRNNVTGTKDIIFGETGLNNAARAQYKQQQGFRGQWVAWNGRVVELVHRGPNRSVLKDMTTGKVHRAKTENVKLLAWGTPAGERKPFTTALYDDLERWLENKHREINKQRSELTEEQFVREVRDGKITPEHLALVRKIDEPSLIYPAEVGITQEEVVQSATEALQSIAKEGFENVHILAPRPETAFEDMVQLYMKERGISGKDRVEFVRSAAQEMRQRLWKKVDKKDRVLAERIRDDMQKLVDGSNLEERAAMQGLRMTESEGRILLRDVNSGVEYSFPSRGKAEEAVNAVVRFFEDEGAAAGLPPEFFNMPASVPAKRVPDSFALLPGEDINKAYQNALPVQIYHPLRDWFDIVETRSGIKLYSGGFQLIEDGTRFAENEMRPIRSLITKSLSNNTATRFDIADGIKAVANARGTGVSVEEAVADLALSPRTISRVKDAVALGARANEVAGLPASASNYLLDYYGIMQPYRANLPLDKALMDFETMFPEGVPPMVKHIHSLTRLGNEMSLFELDPAHVLNKLYRNVLFKKHVESPWKAMRELTADSHDPMKLNTFTPETRKRIVDSLGGEDGLLALNKAVKDYTSLVRGFPINEIRNSRQISKRLFGAFGITGRNTELILDDLVNAYSSGIYGSLIGWNPKLVIRNITQNIAVGYPRLGGEFMLEAVRIALTPAGYNRAVSAGATRSREAGVPGGDFFFNSELTAGMPLESNTVAGHMSLALVRAGLATGHGLQRVSRTGMTLYSSADDINRDIFFWWQLLHTQKRLRQWQQGRISERKFRDDGMPFFSENVKDEFMLRLERFGNDKALDYIGKAGSDEVHFIYGSNAAPLLLQSTPGRLAGMFTSWPLWAKEAFWTRMKRGTPSQKAAFWVRTGTVAGALYLVGKEFDVDLTAWVAPLAPLNISAGPILDEVMGAAQFFNASLASKPKVASRIGKEFLKNAIPGAGFFRNVRFTLEEAETPTDMFFNLALGRSTGNRNNYFVDVQMNPAVFIPGIDPPQNAPSEPFPQPGLRSQPDSSLLRSNSLLRPGGGQ